MQFADIDMEQMESINPFCKTIVGVIQCDYCWDNGCHCSICNCCDKETAKIETDRMALEDNMSHTISMTVATISEQVITVNTNNAEKDTTLSP